MEKKKIGLFKIHIKKYFKLIDRFLYTKIEDLISMRNTIVFITGVFCLISILKGNTTIAVAALGIWNVIVVFFFHYRNKSEGKISSYEQETEKIKDEINQEA